MKKTSTEPAISPPSVQRVWIETLKLTHFRNYSTGRMDCDDRHIVLTGENGSGKTNLLEAVSYLSPGRGLRRAAHEEVAKVVDMADPLFGTWIIFASLVGPVGSTGIGTGISRTPGGPAQSQRQTHINGAAARTSDALLDHARIVWLTPSMDGLFSGPASDRRRFIDRMVLAIDPSHGKRVSEFERAMRSRNKLLEDMQPDGSWLDAIEAQIAETGAAMAFARQELIALLTAMIDLNSSESAVFPRAEIAMKGSLQDLAASHSAAHLEDSYKQTLFESRAADRRAGRMLEGPHRSDLIVRHGPKSMPAGQCSTGEQKALLLGLVLAHARLVGDVSGMAPLLLLDEVAAHLDEQRRAGLFDQIDAMGGQAWMTGTDRNLFDAMGQRGQYFTVSQGTVAKS